MSDSEIRSESDFQSESWSTTTVYDAVYEKDNAEAVNVVQGDKVTENENAIEEEVYEEYDGDYQEYTPRYATYSKNSESITHKLLKKKMLVILVLLVVCSRDERTVKFSCSSSRIFFSFVFCSVLCSGPKIIFVLC